MTVSFISMIFEEIISHILAVTCAIGLVGSTSLLRRGSCPIRTDRGEVGHFGLLDSNIAALVSRAPPFCFFSLKHV